MDKTSDCILLQVFNTIPMPCLMRLRRVCKRWKSLIEDHTPDIDKMQITRSLHALYDDDSGQALVEQRGWIAITHTQINRCERFEVFMFYNNRFDDSWDDDHATSMPRWSFYSFADNVGGGGELDNIGKKEGIILLEIRIQIDPSRDRRTLMLMRHMGNHLRINQYGLPEGMLYTKMCTHQPGDELHDNMEYMKSIRSNHYVEQRFNDMAYKIFGLSDFIGFNRNRGNYVNTIEY
jgi:hypothetical protein